MDKTSYIKEITEIVKLRATCPQDKVGAVFVSSDYEILATGYNGAPRGRPHCPRDCSGKCFVAIHAECNAIIQAAKNGVRLEGAQLFVSRWPCYSCASMLVNLRVSRVVSWGKVSSAGVEVLRLAGIKTDVPS